jgi:hypothetical protein
MLARTPRRREFGRSDGHMEIRCSSIDGRVELRVLADSEFPERRFLLSRSLAAELGALLVRITELRH